MNVKKDKAKTQKGRIEKQGETARQKRGYEKERKRRENGIREIEKDRRRARERNEMHLVLEVGRKKGKSRRQGNGKEEQEETKSRIQMKARTYINWFTMILSASQPTRTVQDCDVFVIVQDDVASYRIRKDFFSNIL